MVYFVQTGREGDNRFWSKTKNTARQIKQLTFQVMLGEDDPKIIRDQSQTKPEIIFHYASCQKLERRVFVFIFMESQTPSRKYGSCTFKFEEIFQIGHYLLLYLLLILPLRAFTTANKGIQIISDMHGETFTPSSSSSLVP
eukprot:TRINITY_DN8398_c0_g3_i9.p2 TRINITY_DN8398_c0_g3~~TRINITY_DN8398_c0_g3_i9.p2  ORF type:complete len:141 (-),score=1.42 TRINITY_DN8398_c0_g3_i9:765-1187(-)